MCCYVQYRNVCPYGCDYTNITSCVCTLANSLITATRHMMKLKITSNMLSICKSAFSVIKKNVSSLGGRKTSGIRKQNKENTHGKTEQKRAEGEGNPSWRQKAWRGRQEDQQLTRKRLRMLFFCLSTYVSVDQKRLVKNYHLATEIRGLHEASETREKHLTTGNRQMGHVACTRVACFTHMYVNLREVSVQTSPGHDQLGQHKIHLVTF